MFRILRPDDLIAVPWKNGGGITREILLQEDAAGFICRISIADVTNDGPFSHFPGLTRILTVITGDGIDLIAPGGTIPARKGNPVCFSGDLALNGRLTAGPIRDLNVIFDPLRVNAEVQHLNGPRSVAIGPMLSACLMLDGTGRADDMPFPTGTMALGQSGQIDLDPGVTALLVTISPFS